MRKSEHTYACLAIQTPFTVHSECARVCEPTIRLIVRVCVRNRLFPPTAIVHYRRTEESEQSLHCGGLRLREEEEEE